LVVEADRIAAGVSGYTTAKLTAGHGLLYSHLERSFGTDAARLYAESQLAGLAHVFDLCKRHAIDCDLETRPNYVVADTDDQLEKLDGEVEASRGAGLAVRRVDDLGIVPFPAAGALALEDQAQFHVRKYLLALADLIVRAGGRIVERSRVTESRAKDPTSYERQRVSSGQALSWSRPTIQSSNRVSLSHAYILTARMSWLLR